MRKICRNTYHHHSGESILRSIAARSDQQGREGEQERTWASRLPLRKTVKPLHLSSWANRNASATSDSVAVEGRLIVFETPLSLER